MLEALPQIFEHFAMPAAILGLPVIILVLIVVYAICVIAPDKLPEE